MAERLRLTAKKIANAPDMPIRDPLDLDVIASYRIENTGSGIGTDWPDQQL